MQARDLHAIQSQYPMREYMKRRWNTVFKGKSTKCLCPISPHDRQASCNIFPNKTTGLDNFHCHGCGKQGDLIELIMQVEGKTKAEAIDSLAGPLEGKPIAKAPPPPKKQPTRAYGVFPADFEYPRKGREVQWRDRSGERKSRGNIGAVYRYRNPQNVDQVIGLTIRWDYPPREGEKKGRKVVLPFRYFEGDLWNEGWSDEPHFPLYGLEHALRHKDKTIVWVEGEKNALDGNTLLNNSLAWVSWQSGGKAVEKIDPTILKGRRHVLWPDAVDGIETMDTLAKMLEPDAAALDVLKPDPSWEKGYDVSDMILDYTRQGRPAVDVLDWMGKPENFRRVKSPVRVVELKPDRDASRPGWLPNQLRLNLNKEGDVSTKDEVNLYHVLSHHPDFAGQFQFDTFDRELLFRGEKFDRVAAYELQAELALTKPFLKPGIKMIQEMVSAIGTMQRNQVNRLRDYLLSLQWDEKPRLAPGPSSPGLLPAYAGVEPDEFSGIIGARWMVGLVRRILNPGHQHDALIVLEGGQGNGKTSFYRTLAKVGSWDLYTDLSSAAMGRDKDDMMKMGGKCIIEMGEMTAQSKADVGAFKHFTTVMVDRYRPPYGAEILDFPRTFVFCGSTNKDSQYLADVTGNRRFWPATVTGEIQLGLLAQDREQIWAEAVHLAGTDFQNWLTDDEQLLHADLIRQREVSDAWEPRVADIVKGLPQHKPAKAGQILALLDIPTERHTRAAVDRLVPIMASLGWRWRRGAPTDADRSLAFRKDKRRRDP